MVDARERAMLILYVSEWAGHLDNAASHARTQLTRTQPYGLVWLAREILFWAIEREDEYRTT